MYTENNGVKVWYEIHGQGEPTLIMIPGFQIVHSEMFKRTFVPFLSRHMRVVTLDMRGSGKSDRPDEGYDFETYVEDVHAVAEAARLDRFAMAGHSCGALTIIKYHATHPGRVSHLISLNGYARMVQSEDYPQGMPKEVLAGAKKLWREQPETMLKGFIERACSEKHSLRHKELIWEWAHETSPEIWEMGFAASTLSEVDKHLKNIDVPVLICHGQKDKIIFSRGLRLSSSKNPRIEVYTHIQFRPWLHTNLAPGEPAYI